MGLLLHSLLLLSLSTFTAGVDFQLESKPFAQSFLRHLNIEERAVNIIRRALPAWLSASPNHKRTRRNAELGENCKALQGYDTKLADNTHRVSYQLRSCYSSHVWQLNEPRHDDAQVLTRCT